MIKKIVAILTIVLAIGLCVFLRYANNEEQREAAKYEEMSEKRRPLQVKRQKLQQELEDLKKEYEASKLPKGTTQVIFTGLEADVYNVCYPIMKEHEYTGTLAVSLTQFPGMEGLLSVEQFQQLLNEGWKVCVKWDSQNPVEAWLPQLLEKMKQFNVETLPIVYFTAGTYTKALDGKLAQMGFSIAVHHGEEQIPLIQLSEEEGIWHVGSVGLMGEKPKLRLTEAISQKGNIAYLVGFELEDEKYDERSFRSMLGYFDSYESKMELIVSNIEEARQHYRERGETYEHAKEEEYNNAKEALEKELAQVEKELAELGEQ